MGGACTVSVVIPTYNRKHLLGRAIESVLSQTFRDFELLVVDDASTDGTGDLIGSYDDERIRYFRHETNRGTSAARNTGLANSNGDYISFLDSDDEWHRSKLEMQVSWLEEASPEAVATYCDVVRMREGAIKQLGERLFPENVGHEGGENLVGAILGMEVAVHPGSTLLYKRETAEDLFFDEELEILEDIDFLIQLLLRGELIHVDEELVTQYETGYPSLRAITESRNRFLTKYAAEIEAFEHDGWAIRSIHEFYLAKAYLREGRFPEGIVRLSRSSVPDARQFSGLVWSLLVGTMSSLRTTLTHLSTDAPIR